MGVLSLPFTRARPTMLVLVLSSLWTAPTVAALQDPFHAPVPVGDGAASAPTVTLDASREPAIAYLTAAGVAVARGTNAFRDPVVVASGAIYHAPRITPGTLGTLYLVFQEDDPDQPERGGEIYTTSNLGGPWRRPSNLTRNDVDDRGPVAASGPGGVPRIAWTRADGTILLDDGSESRGIARGVAADLAVDAEGAVHLVYTRDGDVFYARQDGDVFIEHNLTASPGADESSPRLALSPDGAPSVLYVREGALLLRHGDLAEEVSVSGDLAGASHPALAAGPGGLFLVFAAEGRLYGAYGPPMALSAPRVLPGGEGASAQVAVVIGPDGLVHVAFERDGAVYYTNNAHLPEPAFASRLFSIFSNRLKMYSPIGAWPE